MRKKQLHLGVHLTFTKLEFSSLWNENNSVNLAHASKFVWRLSEKASTKAHWMYTYKSNIMRQHFILGKRHEPFNSLSSARKKSLRSSLRLSLEFFAWNVLFSALHQNSVKFHFINEMFPKIYSPYLSLSSKNPFLKFV